jgi:dienelactone hydrolase
MKKRFRWVLLGLLPLAGAAQTPAQPKPALSWKDVASYRSIPTFGGTSLSPDGRWMAYVLAPVEGDAELLVRKTGDTTTYRYPIGSPTFPQMSFSDDSKYFAFKVFPKDKDKKAAAKTPGRPLPEKLMLVELAGNKKTEFERVRNFAFNGERASHLAVQLTPAPGGTPPMPSAAGTGTGSAASSAPKGSDLLLVELGTGKAQNIGNVAEMAFNKRGEYLALVIDATEQAGNGLHLRNLATGTTTILDTDKAQYQSLNWTERGDGFAALKGTKDEKYKSLPQRVVGVRNLTGTPEVIVYDPKLDSLKFPKGMTVSPNRRPMWSEDLGTLFFGVHKLELAKKEPPAASKPKTDSTKTAATPQPSEAQRLTKIRADTTIKTLDDLQKALARVKTDSAKVAQRGGTVPSLAAALPKKDEAEKPDMVIWHWQDKRLQSQQQVQETSDKNFSYLAMYQVGPKQFVRLADSTLRNVNPAPKQRFALGFDDSNYELDANLDGQNYADVYAIDLQTGAKTKVFTKFYQPNFYASPRPSPDGTKFVYAQDGQFFVYDLVAKTSRNLTEKMPTKFVDVDDDHNVKTPPTPVLGWSNDSKQVLLSDGWDLWRVPVDGGAAQNLTVNGRRDRIRYQTRFQLDPEEKGIDFKQPQYLRLYGERTKKSGIARLDVDKRSNPVAGPKVLLWEDAAVAGGFGDGFVKAKKAPTYVFAKETFTQPREYYLSTSPDLSGAQAVTKNAPDLAKYAWSAGTRLVDYVSDKGDSLQGALFLPAGYEAGKKYPTIVYYYEKLSQTLHSFANPGYSGTGWNPGVYTSNGYAVFIPDIVYKLNDPGMSAVWCVLPAVKAALKTGVIDETKMGIHGHSWGGYQTAFLVTQTNQFKAAAAGAPLTDMVSMYALIYKNVGITNGRIFEASQGRLEAPWENWEAYNRNSPLYHVKKVQTPLLMLHNDADGAVDFTQGIEYYNALRRLKKPVVLMQYKGENHGLAKLVNRKDYSVRMMEFFDYHLKGKAAPDWWKSGIDRLGLEEHLEKRVMNPE